MRLGGGRANTIKTPDVDRETIDETYPGDILGVVNPGEFRLGDTICQGQPFHYEPLPRFCPEHFAVIRCPGAARRKQFNRGLQQLVEEGTVQVFVREASRHTEPILAAVGELQFDVVRYRLEAEYDASTSIEWLAYRLLRLALGRESSR